MLSGGEEATEGVDFSLYQFIAVGTPPDEDGSADLSQMLSVAESIGRNMDDYRIVIDKSTVPVCTADLVPETIKSVLEERGKALDFDVVSNPGFLQERDAVDDFMKSEREDNPRTKELLRNLYAPFNRSRERFIVMGIRSAELTRYPIRATLATKISFMNEIAKIAERAGDLRRQEPLQPRHGGAGATQLLTTRSDAAPVLCSELSYRFIPGLALTFRPGKCSSGPFPRPSLHDAPACNAFLV